MKGIEELVVTLFLVFFILVTPMFFIALDFWSGVRKAKQRGEDITSDGWQRTVRKLARYYNFIFAFMVVDALQITGIWYLHNYWGCSIPIFPMMTMIGAMIVAAIEIRSIFEKTEEKMKRDVTKVALLAREIARYRTDPEEVAKAISKYMKGGEGDGTSL